MTHISAADDPLALARDPQVLRRTARRVASEAARGLERASLMAAKAREQVGDLWAEVREEALSEVDAADFNRAAASASEATPAAAGVGAAAASAPGVAGTAEVAPAPQGKAPRKPARSPRKPRSSRAVAKGSAIRDATG